jgi:hypothetical protein
VIARHGFDPIDPFGLTSFSQENWNSTIPYRDPGDQSFADNKVTLIRDSLSRLLSKMRPDFIFPSSIIRRAT